MSKGTRRYKKPTIVIALGGILADIIGATWAFWLHPPTPDFSISINSKHKNRTIKKNGGKWL